MGHIDSERKHTDGDICYPNSLQDRVYREGAKTWILTQQTTFPYIQE